MNEDLEFLKKEIVKKKAIESKKLEEEQRKIGFNGLLIYQLKGSIDAYADVLQRIDKISSKRSNK